MKKRLILLLGFVLLVGGPSATNANPVGGVVQAGTATITAGGPGSLTINQATDKAIINWNSFSIGAGEATRFVQPSASATALNRVMGGNPSSIYGMLQANGNVIVINPAGILVGPSGVINTHSFMGSTLDINNSSFLSGVGMKFSGNSTAGVKNEGTINAIGGDIFLFAHTVDNVGALNATEGTVGLAAGSEILLKQTGNEKVSVLAGNVTAPRTATGVNNAGAVKAASAELKAAGGNMYALAINNGGIVRADTVVNEGGRIFLRASGGNIENSGTLAATAAGGKGGSITMDGGHNASDPATVTSSGVIDAHGTTGAGGTVNIFGDYVGLFGSALVDVSGATGGGTALIGGDLRGENPDVQNAERTFVNAGARILADATSDGDGGKIIVWSQDVTRYNGSLSARGGPLGGNGGFAEISGKNNLVFNGSADLSARNESGTSGTLLLDPKNIIVTTNIPGGSTTNVTSPFTNSGTVDSFILPSTLVGLLNSADVLFQANTDIRFLNDVDASLGANNNFTLQAGRSILVGVGAPVTLRIHGQFTATVNDSGATGNRDTGPGDFNMFAGSLIDTGSGTAATDRTISISMGTGPEVGDFTIANLTTSPPAPGVNGGQVTLQNTTGKITLTGTIDTSGRTMTNGNASGGNGGAISLTTTTGTITTSGGSLVANGGSANGNNANGGLGGTITLTAGSGSIDTSTGTVTANGGDATGTGNPNGGAGGHVTLTNGSGGANLGPITANGGAGNGSGSPGDAGTIIVTSGGPITVSSDLTALIGTNGSGGSPTPGSVTLAPTNAAGAVSGIGTIRTDTLNLNGIGAIGTSPAPLVTAVNTINLGRGVGANPVFVSDFDNVSLQGTTGGGNLTVTADDVDVTASGLSSGAGLITLIAANNRNIRLTNGASASDFVLTGTDLQRITTTAAGGLSLQTTGSGVISVAGITSGQSANINGALTLISASDITFVTASTFHILDAEAGPLGTILINAGVTTSGNQTYTADTITIAGDLQTTGGGNLVLQPFTPTTAIGIGSAALGSLLFNDTALGHLKDGFSSITFGRLNGQHAIDINTAIAFTDPVVFRSPAAPGSITVNGKLVGTNNASITLNGSHATTTLNADIVTSGAAININDKVVLGAVALVTLDTTAGNTSPAGAAIHIFDTINDDATPSTLVTISGTAGITTLDNDIGNLFPLSGFQASGLELVLGGANLRTDFGGPVNFNGLTRVTLGNNVTIRTDFTGGDGIAGPITFGTATVNGNAVGRTLILDTTGVGGDFSANVFLGPVGNTTPLGALTVRANQLNLNNNINTDGIGGVDFSAIGAILLGANVTIDTDAVGGATAAGPVSFGSALIENFTTSRNLIVNATSDSGAAGAVTLGPIGQIILPLALVDISGGSISAQAVRTVGNQTYTSDTIALNGNLLTTTAGTLTLQPLGNATTIGIGTGAAGMFSLDNTELAFLLDGFSAINIGRVAGSHAIDVTTASFTDNVNFRASTGTLTLHNDLQNNTGGGFDFSGVGSVVLANTVTIDTDLLGNTTGAGAVTFGSTPVTANAANRSLTIDASADGGGANASVTLAAVGSGGTPLDTLTVSGNNLTLGGAVRSTTVILTASGTLSGVGLITATSLALSVDGGIGSLGTPLSTAVANLEASANTGGIFINNTGNLTIGNVSGAFNGVHVNTSGDIVLNNAGSINIDVPGENVTATDNVTISATGATANIQTGGNQFGTFSLAQNLQLSAGQDILLGSPVTGLGRVFGGTGISMNAGRDIVVSAGTTVRANGGSIVATAARNFDLSASGGAGAFIIGANAIPVPITLTATTGILSLDSGPGGSVSSSGGIISLNAPSASAVTINVPVNAGAAGTVTLNHNGALTGSGMITAGTLNLQGTGAVGTLGGRLNTTVGIIALNKTIGGSFVNEFDGVNLQGTAPAFDLLAGGAIGQSGALNVTGAAAFKTLNAAGAAITLDRIGDTVNNSFGSVSAQVRNAADTANAAAAVTIHENAVDGTVLAGVRTLGALNVVSSGPITQTAPVVANGAGQTATFSAAANAINLGDVNNDFSTVVFTGTDVTLTDANGLDLGASTATGNLLVTAAGPLSQSGILTANGAGKTATFNAVGNSINLSDPNNDFETARFSGQNVTLTDKNSLILGTSTATGNLIVTTGGNLTQSGLLTANGAANFAAFLASAANSDILLGGQANDIKFAFFGLTGAGSIHDLSLQTINAAPQLGLPTTIGNDVTLTFNNAGITLPSVSVGGNLSVTASGTIDQTGPLTVTGVGKTASFTAVGNTILLTDLNNDFGTAAFSGANVTLVDKNALVLGTSTATGNLTVSTTGNITQSGALTANGASTVAVFSPGAVNNVDLALANNFTSVSVPSANNITLNDVDGFTIGATKAAGTLDLRTSVSGDITQVLNAGDPSLGPIIEAQNLIGDVKGALVLGSLGTPSKQPQNKIGTIGALTHGTSATLTVPDTAITGQQDFVGLYIFDSDSTAYSGSENPVLGNAGAVLGLVINGLVTGTGMTIIRTLGDLELTGASGATSVETTVATSDILLSAENDGNFHNLLGFGGTLDGSKAVKPGLTSRFLIFSTDSTKNFGNAIADGQLKFNGLSTVNPKGKGFLADQVVFDTKPTPIIRQDGKNDDGTLNGFVFVIRQNFIQQDESAKFFLDLINLVAFSAVDATAKASEKPDEDFPTIWTSSYHIYEKEQKEKQKKGNPVKKLSSLSPFWEIQLEGNHSWTSSRLVL